VRTRDLAAQQEVATLWLRRKRERQAQGRNGWSRCIAMAGRVMSEGQGKGILKARKQRREAKGPPNSTGHLDMIGVSIG